MLKNSFSGLKNLFNSAFKGVITAAVGFFVQDAAKKALDVANTLFRGEKGEVIREKAAAIAIQRLGVNEAFGEAIADVIYEGVLWALERVEKRV